MAPFWSRAWATGTSVAPLHGCILGTRPGRAPPAANPFTLCKGSPPKELVPSQRASGGTCAALGDRTHRCQDGLVLARGAGGLEGAA